MKVERTSYVGHKPLFALAAAFLLFSTAAFAQYVRTDLVSNQAGAAPNTDAHLVNGWGLVSLATSPFWVSDNGTGFSTLYRGTGQQVHLFVEIPPAPGSPADTPGTPTGVVGNISPNAHDFTVTEDGKSGKANFIFATLDGTISGWNPTVAGVDPVTGLSHASPAANRSDVGASYTGLAIGAISVEGTNHFLLYAADDGPNRRVDVFDANFHLVNLPDTSTGPAFTDRQIPRNFAPYGIQNIKGDIWVTYTALNKAQSGFVDRFAADGTLKQHAAARGPLHSPWGLAQAPSNFGPMSNAILVTNNITRGRINAFDANTGDFLGPLLDASGNAIEIDNIWAIQFGQGNSASSANGTTNQLFFTAGPNSYADGLFGVITFGP
jgi:uncharacterized protein (TIGR03118 family)